MAFAADDRTLICLIYDVSRTVASAEPPQTVVDRVAGLIDASLGTAYVLLQVDDDLVCQRGSAPPGQPEPFRFERELVCRGNVFGRLSVAVLNPEFPALLTAALNAVSQLVANWCHQRAFEQLRRQTIQFLADTRSELAAVKRLARAAGIIALRKGISMEQARKWIRTEARCRRWPVEDLVEKLVLDADLERRITAGIMPLKRPA